MAYKGIGTRPLYVAGSLIALVGAAGCNMLIPSRLDIVQAADEVQRKGAQFLFDNGPPITIMWLAAAFGSLIGAIIYRRPAQPTS